MSTQQDIYAAGSENRPPMLNKENYVPWSSRLLWYAKSRPNGKLIHNSIINGPYVRRMIPEPGDPNREVPMNETFHVQTYDELTEKELRQIKSDDQAIQTILLDLPEDIYAAVDSPKLIEITNEKVVVAKEKLKEARSGVKRFGIKGKLSPRFIGLFEILELIGEIDDELTKKELKLIESDDQAIQTILLGLPEDIYAAVDSCENAQEIWLRVQQMMKDDLRAERLAKTQDLLALMATSNNPYTFPVLHQDQPTPNITNLTTAMNMALALMAKAFKLNYSTPTNNNQRISSNPRNRQIAQPGNLNGYNAIQNVRNQNSNGNSNLVAARAEGNATGHNGNQIRCYNCIGLGHFARNCTVKPKRRDAAYLQTQLLIAQKEEAGIQLQAKEFDLMAAAADFDEIEEVNANCILMANLQQASTSGTQTDKAPVYDSDGSAEVHNYDNCYDNEIFNMFTQEEQYTELLEPIPEPHQVPQNDNNVIFEVSSVEQSRGTIEQHPVNVEETRVLYDLVYNNLAIEVEKVNTVNRKLRETNAELTTELGRYKNQEKCFEISQEKYDKLERCYQKSVYQEQCLKR
nr:ribonuclease H-like domain-containing protein [Tanacetum cinerariifolium]